VKSDITAAQSDEFEHGIAMIADQDCSKNASVVFPIILIVLLSLVQILGASGPETMLLELGNDSAMRLVSIRDLLAGQGWWDLNQYRLGPEGGFEMHWSRLVDAPMIAMIGLFDAIGLPGGGEYWLVVIWPLFWFAVGVLSIWRIAGLIGGQIAAFFAALIGASMLISHNIYRPGSIDHHNIQIALLFVAVLGILARHKARYWPLVAGVVISASLGIGIETMPHLAIIACAMAMIWAIGGARESRAVEQFAIGIISTMTIVLGLFAPRSALVGGYCDAVSIDLAVPLGIGAAVLWGAARLVSRSGLITRFVSLAIGGVIVLALALAFFPACLSNPLDTLDPYLHTHWLDFVAEAQGLPALLSGRAPQMFVSFYVFGAVCIGLSVYLSFADRTHKEAWILLSALGLAALFFSAYQLRGVVLLAALGVVPVSALASRLRNRWQETGRIVFGLAALVLVLASVPTVWGMGFGLFDTEQSVDADTTGQKKPAQDHLACIDATGMGALAGLPAGVVSSNSNLGAQILLNTPHRVLAAPYHRNEAGMRIQLEIAFSQSAEAAYELLRDAGVNYVTSCPADPELGSLHRSGFTGFGWQLQNGAVPDFLAPVVIEGETKLKLFRLRD
jgi:hypothetical protein